MYTVLLADDKEAFRRKIKRLPYWSSCGEKFKIAYEVQNGLEALECLKKHPVDVVVTDIRMPFVDGIELLKQIKAGGLCGCVILLSEFAEFSYAKEGILNGAFDYVVKPVDNDKIQETFERAYHYLTTLQDVKKLDLRQLDALVDFLLAGNRENVMAYAAHINGELVRAYSGRELAVRVNEILKYMEESIIDKQPFWQYYLPMDRLFKIDLEREAQSQPEGLLDKKIAVMLKQMSPFFVKSENSTVRAVCRIALEGVEDRLNLRDIAGNLFVNPKYLGGLFKQHMGCSFSNYVTYLKMQRALLLLEDPEQRVQEIALRLGYNDVNYFSRLFKESVGVSPSAYREEAHDGD